MRPISCAAPEWLDYAILDREILDQDCQTYIALFREYADYEGQQSRKRLTGTDCDSWSELPATRLARTVRWTNIAIGTIDGGTSTGDTA